jgi:hypothetical protein
MRSTRFAVALAAVIAVGAFVAPPKAHAVTYSAYEYIYDITPPNDLFDRDLQRERLSASYSQLETSDSTIAAENNVSPSFGLWVGDLFGIGDVTYTHNMNWIVPPASTWLSAVLTITAYGVDGNNDHAIVDSVNIGNLANEPGGFLGLCSANPLDCAFTTSVFNSVGDPVLVTGLIADGMLNVTIDKNGLGDGLSVVGSRLDVTYDSAPVPEPVTMLLLGPAMGYCVLRRRAARS